MYKKNENGQAAIILVFAVLLAIVFAALAIDAGQAYTAKREAQNAADAAAIAGTRQLVLECASSAPLESNISQQAQQIAGGSNATAYYKMENTTTKYEVGKVGFVPCTCGSRAVGINVVVNAQTTTFLAGIFGQGSVDVTAEATAEYGPIETVSEGLYPFTRRMPANPADYLLGQTQTLRIVDDADTLPGSFGWLTWDGQNNIPALADSLTAPGNSQIYYNPGTPANGWTPDMNDHAINVTDWVQGAPGNKNSNQVRTLLDWHIAHKTPMIIPLYNEVAGEGSHSNYKVAGFAAWELQSYDFTGNEKSMTGKFLRWVTNGNWAPSVCGSDGNVYSVKLTD